MNSQPLSGIERLFIAQFRKAISSSPRSLLPPGLFTSFEYTRTGENYTHPRAWGLIVKACWTLPNAGAVEVDLRLNLGGGLKFQPDVAVRNSIGDIVLAIDYEGPNSSDARVPSKDVEAYIDWAKEFRRDGAQPPPYLIITTLPHRPKKGDWEAKWTAEGQYNEGHWRNRKFIERCPHEYWYSLYRKEVRKLMEKAPWATIHFLNLNGRRLKHESL